MTSSILYEFYNLIFIDRFGLRYKMVCDTLSWVRCFGLGILSSLVRHDLYCLF